MRRLIGLTLAVLALSTPPAWAGPSEADVLRFMRALPKSRWQRIPDSAEAGTLWAGRVGAFTTLVRTRSQGSEVVFERVEVALPQDASDEFALAIHARFVSQFVGHPDELRATMSMLRALRRTIIGSGRRDARQMYRSHWVLLTLDTASAESGSAGQATWGTLFWKVEVQPISARTP